MVSRSRSRCFSLHDFGLAHLRSLARLECWAIPNPIFWCWDYGFAGFMQPGNPRHRLKISPQPFLCVSRALFEGNPKVVTMFIRKADDTNPASFLMKAKKQIENALNLGKLMCCQRKWQGDG